MRGNITRRGKSSWRLKYDVGTDSDRQIAYVTVRGTGKQAEAELAKRLNELAEGRYVAPTVETVESYARHWLANIAPAERSPLTLERYTSIIRAHIIPRLGPIPLQALDGKAIDGFYAHCRKQGRRDGAGLASGTLQNVHRLLSQVLRSAVKAKKLARSPIDDVETQPKPKRKKIEVLDESEIATLLAHLKGHWLYMPTVLAAYTGMRRGEVLGLRWRDIDFDKGTLQIAQAIELIGGKICVTAPKTERSSRTINLPASLLPEPPASEGASRFAAEAGAWQVRSSFHIARGQGNSSRRVLQHFHLQDTRCRSQDQVPRATALAYHLSSQERRACACGQCSCRTFAGEYYA